jgi:hypothetical protein
LSVRVETPNVADHRRRASDIQDETEAPWRRSVQRVRPLCAYGEEISPGNKAASASIIFRSQANQADAPHYAAQMKDGSTENQASP